MAVPPITMSAEPDVSGSLAYLRVAPTSATGPARAMLGLRLRIHNNGTATARLNRIRVSFPDDPSSTRQFDRDVTFRADETKTVFLAPDEAIALGTPPATVRIGVFFDGFAEPREIQRNLRAHVTAVPGGSYRFPGRAANLHADEYFTHNPRHSGGAQFFGYDIGVRGWDSARNEFTPLRPGADPATNEARRAWGQPVHAMAKGVVIAARNDRDDNPAPGRRSVQRLGDATAGPVGALSVTRLSDNRIATAVRTADTTLQITTWNLEDDGALIVPRGHVQGDPTDLVALDALTANRLVTATRRPGGSVEVRRWSVSDDGTTISPLASRTIAPGSLVSLARLEDRRFVVALRTEEGHLRVIIFEVAPGTSELLIRSHAFAGPVSAVGLAVVSPRRLVTAVRTAEGDLKVLAWALSEDALTLTQTDAATDGAISRVACAVLPGRLVATCARTAAGRLKIIIWRVSDDGTLTQVCDAAGGPIGQVAAVRVTRSFLVTATTTSAGTLDMNVWHYDAKDQELRHLGRAGAGTTDLVAVDMSVPGTVTTAVRTAEGHLKVIAWYVGSAGGNRLVILHGDELVLYAHLQKGSIPASVAEPGAVVTDGQLVGRLGNSGRSSGPHLHLHAWAAPFTMTAEDMIQAHRSGNLLEGPYRPLPFWAAQAMRLADVDPAANGSNPFTVLDGHGLYFDRMAVWPGATTPGVPIADATTVE